MRTLQLVRDLGARASVVALLVATAGTVSRWHHRRSSAAHHRQAGWP